MNQRKTWQISTYYFSRGEVLHALTALFGSSWLQGTWTPNHVVSIVVVPTTSSGSVTAGGKWLGADKDKWSCNADESMITIITYPPVACAHHCYGCHPDWGLQWKVWPFFHVPLTSYSNSKHLGNIRVSTGITAEKYYSRKWFCETDMLKIVLEACILQSQGRDNLWSFSLTHCAPMRVFKWLDDKMSA